MPISSASVRAARRGIALYLVTTKHVLIAFGMETLCDLPDIEALEDVGLLSWKGVDEEVLAAAEEEEG